MRTPENDELSLEMERRFKALCKVPIEGQQFSIYRVPSHIRNNNESYYEPRMVSIGPYHRAKEHLRTMEEHKWRYLQAHISTGRGQKHDYIREIRAMEASIRTCYIESFDLSENQFAEMMLLDICFIIQLFYRWRFEKDDPVREIGWSLPLLISDLLMLENQIPFFVLTDMYNIYMYGSVVPTEIPGDTRPSLLDLLTDSLRTMYKRNEGHNPNPKASNIKHLLHLFYILFVPTEGTITTTLSNCIRLQVDPIAVCRSKKVGEKERSPRMIPSVTELQEFGVTFKKKKEFSSFLDISFKKGVLKIPCILVEESIRARYLNLIAFEQCSGGDKQHLTSYAAFMDCLINTSQDVIALQNCGIIENKLANAEEAAKFFNQLRDCAYIDFEKHYLNPVFVNVKRYCDAFWPKHRAKLRRDYFSSPWTLLSLLAALLVLAIQIFTVIVLILGKDFQDLLK